jgi:hypothetical protein
MLKTPYRGTKIEASSRNSIPNHSAEEKMLGIPYRGTKLEANFRNFVPRHLQKKTLSQFCVSYFGCFVKPRNSSEGGLSSTE